MCLPNFIEFKEVDETNPLIGIREWKNNSNDTKLISAYQHHTWKPIEGPHKVEDKNSGIYAYDYYNYYNNYYNNNNYNNNNYNYYYYNDYNYYNYNYYNNYYNDYHYNYYHYCISGVIYQWGKVAIHSVGYRSEYAKIKILFTIRKSDAKGPAEFLDWIDEFNNHVEKIAEEYGCETMHWQDFIESKRRENQNVSS